MTADWLEMISTDTQVMHGQAVIAGTRVPVSAILDCLAAGMSAEEITANTSRSPYRAFGRPPPMAPRWRAKNCSRCRESRSHTTLDENPDVLAYVGELDGCSCGT